MRRAVAVVFALSLVVSQFAIVPMAHADIGSGSIVISQLSTGDSQSASNEFVEVYNNTSVDVDISNWCIRYATAADSLQSSPKYCFVPADTQTKLYLGAHAYAVIVTPSYTMPSASSPDGRFTGSGLADAGGHIKLLNASGTVIDKVGWGTALSAEGNQVAIKPTAITSLVRKANGTNTLQDSDNNKADFELKTPLLHGGGVVEVRTPIDICGNVSDVQETMPSGYGYDEAGNCEALINDVCNNLDRIQLVIPAGLEQNDDGSCSTPPPDVCANLIDKQTIVPQGYLRQGQDCFKLEDRALWLSEILPNASGSDTGREYIELYNPQDEAITLEGYTLQIGKSFEHGYLLPSLADRLVILPHAYVTFSDSELGLSLLNTYSGVRLIAPAGNTVSETAYSDPADDETWANVDGIWQYTDRSTPGAPNEARLINDEDVPTVSLAVACPADKYRNPLTNRCRTIEADAAILTDCQDGYYRNPETNRCRKVLSASTSLVSCQPGYSRNPETNRCRKDGADTDSLTPCKAGQERNPATNRCRNVSALTSPASIAAAGQVPGANNNSALPWVLTVAVIGVFGYGVYEWRSEIGSAAAGLIARFKR